MSGDEQEHIKECRAVKNCMCACWCHLIDDLIPGQETNFGKRVLNRPISKQRDPYDPEDDP